MPAHTEGEIVTGDGGDGVEDVMEGEEGGGWDVDDDELELPPDLVSHASLIMFTFAPYCFQLSP